ncbi:MAG TPA: type II toxin-antitoxin system PemK/MazF family toxin [Actinotalea sp.]|nr:type II toxin-antitoxin system PemK/MazF family toxin [Actinotalea sp.]
MLADPDVLLGGDARWIAVALAGVVALSVVRALVRRSRRRPRPGEIWFAFVPFEDGTGGKDRPVLVLSVEGRTCTVARFTSTDRSARRDYRRVPDGVPGLRRTSWVSLHPVRLRRRTMRRRAGAPGLPLVEWFEDAAGLR